MGGQELSLLKADSSAINHDVKLKSEKKFGLKEGHFIICAQCEAVITMPEAMITVQGQHIHEFTNPSQVTYNVGCFSSADGCLIAGEPTDDHTWFKGFSWSYALCSGCLEHIGWYYQNGNEDFFGLIVERLADSSNNA